MVQFVLSGTDTFSREFDGVPRSAEQSLKGAPSKSISCDRIQTGLNQRSDEEVPQHVECAFDRVTPLRSGTSAAH